MTTFRLIFGVTTLAMPVLAALTLPWPAQAAPLPSYELPHYCRKIARLSGQANQTLFTECLTSEQQARAQLAPRWASVPPPVQRYCDGLSRSVGVGRYVRLKSCIDKQTRSRSHPRHRRKSLQGLN